MQGFDMSQGDFLFFERGPHPAERNSKNRAKGRKAGPTLQPADVHGSLSE